MYLCQSLVPYLSISKDKRNNNDKMKFKFHNLWKARLVKLSFVCLLFVTNFIDFCLLFFYYIRYYMKLNICKYLISKCKER